MSIATLESGPLQTERLPGGKRRLLRELRVKVKGELFTVPAHLETDYSSIPTAFLVVVLTVIACAFDYGPPFFLLLLVLPKYSRVDIAGVVHDHLYKTGEVGKWRADLVWLRVAVSGRHRAGWWQAIPSWLIGLVIAGWPAWWRHRHRAKRARPKTPT